MSKGKRIILNFIVFIFFLIFFDQFSKYLVTKYVKLNSIYLSFFGDFFRIVHVRNTGILFSIGSNFDSEIRRLFFIIVPIFILIFILFLSFKEKNNIKRFLFLLIFSGGFGNIIDRIFRPLGVVDFLDLKFFRIFGLERWPTFNFADSYIVIGITLYFIFDFVFKNKK